MDGSASFGYAPLPDASSHIRVLVLEHGDKDDPLRATLLQQSLDEKLILFDAISYCWGSSGSHSEITIRHGDHENCLEITENLCCALKRFRSVSEDRRLWNDAICINQSDKEEKAKQVRLMGSIYAEAQKVLIYLGEPDKSTPKAIKLMEKIYAAVLKSPDDDTRKSRQWIIDNNLPSVGESWKWEPLKEFFRRPWFRRKWIIQEGVLAARPIFHLGKWEKEWDFMVVISKAINEKALAVVDYTESIDLGEADKLQQGLVQFNNLAYLRRIFAVRSGLPLMQLLSMFQASRSSDPRDHMFALLGLARDATHKELDPRYGKDDTVAQVCIDYARFFLRETGNLEVLYRAGLQGQTFLAPSWVPDWYGGHEGAGFECNNGLWDPLQRPKFYNIAQGTRPVFVDINEPTVLGLKGTVIDHIRELANDGFVSTRAVSDKKVILAQQRCHLEQSDRIMSELNQYPTGEELPDVQWRTLICNVTRASQPAPEFYRAAYEAYRRVVLTKNVQSSQEDFVALQPFREALDFHNGDKIFGLTDLGYVGMFPGRAKEGDVIAVLNGGEFPFILRRPNIEEDSNYELVGQCYIHGRMEAGKFDLKDPQIIQQDFFIGRTFMSNITDLNRHEPAIRAMRRFRSPQNLPHHQSPPPSVST